MRVNFMLVLLISSHVLFAQHTSSQSKSSSAKKVNYNGQWRGGFNEEKFGPGNDNTTYVLELTTDGPRVSGYSYTYFNEGPQRYFTICRLNGTLNTSTGEIIVTEVERTRYNTPPTFKNCFQTHNLHYQRVNDSTELLKGTWEPAPGQGPGCGAGVTVLSRKYINRTPLGIKPGKKPDLAITPRAPAQKKPVPAPRKTQPSAPKSSKEDIAKTKSKGETKTTITDTPVAVRPSIPVPVAPKEQITAPHPKIMSRRNDIVKTIAIEQPVFRIDFYDNGEIDGDSISVFFNGKMVLSNQKLTDKPLSLTLELDKKIKENVITMYAENLGSIPPNTAVMIVTDGKKRYEVRLESDLKKSGSVVFTSPDL